jgi:hypothetical protein
VALMEHEQHGRQQRLTAAHMQGTARKSAGVLTPHGHCDQPEVQQLTSDGAMKLTNRASTPLEFSLANTSTYFCLQIFG